MIGSLAEYHRATGDCVQSYVDPIGNVHQAAKRSFTAAQPLIGRTPPVMRYKQASAHQRTGCD
jgi:hypothetical protein